MSLLFSLLFFLGVAHASEAPADPVEVASDADLHQLESRALYQLGLELMELEQFDEAAIVFRRILLEYPDTPASEGAVDMLRAMDGLSRGRGVDGAAMARAELAISQAIVSAGFLGFLVPASTWQPSEPLVPVSMGILGLGAGMTGGLIAAKRLDLSSGQAMAIFTGELLGASNGVLASALMAPRDYRGSFRYMTAGTVVGTAAGAAVAWKLDPTGGQMAMVNAGAMYGAYLTGWSFAYFWDDSGEATWSDRRRVAVRMGLGTDLGAALGGAAAYFFPISRARMNVITLGGLAGSAAATGVAFLVSFYSWNGLDAQQFGAIVLAGGAAGVGTATLLTRKMGTQERMAANGVLLERTGDGWSVGVPMAMVAPGPEGMQVSVPLVSGRW